jgi:hypothetical protein
MPQNIIVLILTDIINIGRSLAILNLIVNNDIINDIILTHNKLILAHIADLTRLLAMASLVVSICTTRRLSRRRLPLNDSAPTGKLGQHLTDYHVLTLLGHAENLGLLSSHGRSRRLRRAVVLEAFARRH